MSNQYARLSRRRFLRGSAATAAALATTTTLPGFALAQPLAASAPNVAIIGAGLAGLNAAYRLRQAGIQATVYEARNRVGGRTFSIRSASGLVYDLGGEFINSDHADMLDLVDELGLKVFNRNSEAAATKLPGSAYYLAGQDLSEATVAADFGPLQRQIVTDANRLFGNYATVAAEFDPLSVRQYLDRHQSKITKPYVRTLMENAIRTEYGVEPADSTALQLLFLFPSVSGQTVEVLGYSDEAYAVVGGSGRIAEELSRRLPGQVQLNRVLRRVAPSGSGYRLEFTGGAAVTADRVLITVPASVLRTVQFDVTLPSAFRSYLAEISLGRDEKLFAEFSQRAWRTSQKFSQDAWTDFGFSSVWDGTQRQIDRPDAALTFFYGGAEVNAMPSNTKGYNAAVARLATRVPGLQAAATGQFTRSNWTTDPFSRGGYVNFRPGQLTRWADFFWIEANNAKGQQHVAFGNLLFAGEHTSDEWYGFMNGAAQTGRLVADVILQGL